MRRIALALSLLASMLVTVPVAAREPLPRLGFASGELTPDNQRLIGAGPGNYFYFVQFVTSGSLAAHAGLRGNDLIAKVDGVRITSPDHVEALLDRAWLNDATSVTLTLWRPHLHANPRTGVEQDIVIELPVPPPATPAARVVAPSVPTVDVDAIFRRCRETAADDDCRAVRNHPQANLHREQIRQFVAGLIADCRRYDKSACAAVRPTMQGAFDGDAAATSAVAASERFYSAFERCKAGYTGGDCERALAAPNLPGHLGMNVVAARANQPTNLNDPGTLWGRLATIAVVGLIAAAVVWRLLSAPASPVGAARGSAAALLASRPSALSLPTARELIATVMRLLDRSRAQPAPPDPASLRDPESARAALKLANAYLQELDGDNSISDPDHAQAARSTLALAARQLQIARAADDSIAFEHQAGDGSTITLSQTKLRAFTIFMEAITYFEADPRRAVTLLQQSIAIDPDHAQAHAKLGSLHYLARDRAQAIAALEQAVRLDPDDIEIVKLLDRARNMTRAEILAYKATNAATTTVSTTKSIYDWGMVALCLGLLIAIFNLASWAGGGVIEGIGIIALILVAPYAMRFYKALGG